MESYKTTTAITVLLTHKTYDAQHFGGRENAQGTADELGGVAIKLPNRRLDPDGGMYTNLWGVKIGELYIHKDYDKEYCLVRTIQKQNEIVQKFQKEWDDRDIYRDDV